MHLHVSINWFECVVLKFLFGVADCGNVELSEHEKDCGFCFLILNYCLYNWWYVSIFFIFPVLSLIR